MMIRSITLFFALSWLPSAAAVDLFDAGRQFQTPSNLVMLVGEFGTFEHRITDRGMDESVEVLEINYYFSTDTEIDGGDILIHQERTGALENPAEGFIGFDFQVPLTLPGGSYYLLWEFPLVGDEEPRDNIGAYYLRHTIRTSPDFDLASDSANAALSGTTLLPGDNLTATSGILNNGPDSADGSYVEWFLSTDQTIGTPDDISLGRVLEAGVGKPVAGVPVRRDFTRNMTIPSDTTPGGYYIGLRIDATRDRNQNNNIYRFVDQITIDDPVPGFVDLKSSAPAAMGIATTRPPEDGTLSFSARVRNTGDKISSAFTVKYYARPTNFNGANGDILLASIEYPPLQFAPFFASPFPSQSISTDLPMFNLVNTEDYYIFWQITGGSDDNTSNNSYLFGTPFRPSNRPELAMDNVDLVDEFGNFNSSFVVFSDYRIRFTGVLENNTTRESAYVYEIRFQRRGNGDTVYSYVYGGGDVLFPGHQPEDAPSPIPGNSTRSFDISVPLSSIRNAAGTAFAGSEIGWWQSGFTTPTYDVTLEVIPLSPSEIPLIDAVPADNEAEFVMRGDRLASYNIAIVAQQFSSPFLPIWDLSYPPGETYPEISVTAELWHKAGLSSARVALQLYANGVPFGTPGSFFTLELGDRSTRSITRVIPDTFPAEATEVRLGLVFEPGSPNDAYRADNEIVFPGFINVGGSSDGRADLVDAGPGLHDVPAAVNPGSANSELGFSIRNAGLTDADASVVDVYLSEDETIDSGSDTFIGQVPVAAIVAGGNTQVRLSLSIPSFQLDGLYYIGWILNSNNDVFPEFTLNNRVVSPDRVTVGAERNLTAWATPFALPTVVAYPGDTLPIVGSRKNDGNAAAGFHSNAILLSTDRLFRNNVTAIFSTPGLTYIDDTPGGFQGLINTTFDLPGDIAPGTYYCRYVFDHLNQIEEIDERDNVFEVGTLEVLSVGQAFQPKIITFLVTGTDTAYLRWTSRADRNYHLELNSDLSGAWDRVTAGAPISGSEGVTEHALSGITIPLLGGELFVRVVEVEK